MVKYAIVGGKVYTPFDAVIDGVILIESGKISYVGKREAIDLTGYTEIDASDRIIFPGLIDLQVNGAGGVMYNDADDNDLVQISKATASTGVTSLLATVLTDKGENLIKKVAQISKFIEKGKKPGSEVIGIHLEGPYLNPKKRGAHSKDYLESPDIAHFQKIEKSAKGNLKIVSLAPELPNALELIKYIKSKGIRCSLAHTQASFDDVIEAIHAGLDMATHLYNAMGGLDSREPGTVGAVLSSDAMSFGVICDGKHVHPMSLKVALRARGLEKVFMVTDAVSPLGTSMTSYKLYGIDVVIQDGGCYTQDGILAGSATPLLTGVKNGVELVGLPIQDAIRLATANPARESGIFHKKGSIEVGKDADIVICKKDFTLENVFIKGSLFDQ